MSLKKQITVDHTTSEDYRYNPRQYRAGQREIHMRRQIFKERLDLTRQGNYHRNYVQQGPRLPSPQSKPSVLPLPPRLAYPSTPRNGPYNNGIGYDKSQPKAPNIIEGQYTYLGDKSDYSRGLANLLARYGPTFLRRAHPILNMLDIVQFAYHLNTEIALRETALVQQLYYPPGGSVKCDSGRPVNNVIRYIMSHDSTSSGYMCSLNSQAITPIQTGNALIFTWATTHSYGVRHAISKIITWPQASALNAGYGLRAVPHLKFAPALTTPALPFAALPYRQSHATPFTGFYSSNGPPKRPVITAREHKWKPPGPRVKERKLRASSAAVKMIMGAANQTTEFLDMLDAVYEAMPKHLKDKTPKNGRCRGPRCVNPGAPFVLPQDKFMTIYRNINQLDVPEAVKNLIVNHYVDNAVGRVFAGADKARSRAGGSGWGINM